jgi:hypothetical protein
MQRDALAEPHFEIEVAKYLDCHIALGMEAELLCQSADVDCHVAHACNTEETSNWV